MSSEKFFPYAKQSITQEDIQAVQKSLTEMRISRGEKTKLFEEKMAAFTGSKWAVSFNSATSALFASYFAAKVQEGDRLISTANSFIATVSPAIARNIKPQFVDIDNDSGNMNLDLLKAEISAPLSRGRYVIVPVHFSGVAIDMSKLEKQIKTADAVVIEDAAHAIGSLYPTGEKVGSCAYSQMTVFSFHPAKTMTTGEGGLVTTNDDELYHRLVTYRNNGLEREKPYIKKKAALGYYEIHELGQNYHLTEMQAALGISQLDRLDAFVEKRRKLVKRYREQLQGLAHLSLLNSAQDDYTAYHLMCVKINFEALKMARTTLMEKLHEAGIGTDVHYIPIYHQPVFSKKYGDISHTMPQTEAYYAQTLSLPLYYDLNEEEVDFICKTLKELLYP